MTTISSLRRRLEACERRVPPPAHSPSANMTTGELRHSITGTLGISESELAVIGPTLGIAILAELARRDARGIR
jgi:hypothetical protein